MKDYIELRAIEVGRYIIDSKATVRKTATKFGVSKSTVHKDLTERLTRLIISLKRNNGNCHDCHYHCGNYGSWFAGIRTKKQKIRVSVCTISARGTSGHVWITGIKGIYCPHIFYLFFFMLLTYFMQQINSCTHSCCHRPYQTLKEVKNDQSGNSI